VPNGIRVATADLNLDGIADIIVSASRAGGGAVSIYDGQAAALGQTTVLHSFVPFPTKRYFGVAIAGSWPAPGAGIINEG
jgi:hypothetical protein